MKRVQNNRQKKRMEKLIQKFSLDSSTIQRDTIYSISLDTVYFPEIKWDTLHTYQLDSVLVVQKDGVKTELKIMTDTFWLKNTVFERDTVIEIKDTTVYVEKIKLVDNTKETVIPKWRTVLNNISINLVMILIFIVIGFFVGKLIKIRR
jgi:hypothetical protein